MTTDVRRVIPGDPLFPQAAALFDDYRRHYGMPVDPAATERWLRTQHDTDRLRLYAATTPAGRTAGENTTAGNETAGEGGDVGGILTACVVPASWGLRTWWSVRDVYVAPDARRGGLARALLAHVAAAARAEGAVRLSLQTEDDNEQALLLYAAAGFQPVTGLTQLSLGL